MSDSPSIYVGQAETPQRLLLNKANRHGLIAGATGTGKTVSLQVLAEGFSAAGVPCFMADVKGDFAGVSQPGEAKPRITERCEKIGLKDWAPSSFPVIFWDLFGKQGHPIRATVSDMGPLLLSRLMALSDAQEGVLNIAFKVADENGWLLLDLKDLRALLVHCAEDADALRKEYGNVTDASVGAIQRQLLVLEEQGGDSFFGEPALHLEDLMRTSTDGRGYMNVLAADKLMQNPRLYATFLLWLLAELFEQMPEAGDVDKPKLVFFFDEAHLLFDEAPPALLDKINQVVRLIRSKGIGVYFITQNPIDVPDSVLAQMGNRVQHALRAFTPREQKAVDASADTFRPNPKINVKEVITQLGVGEALTSFLQEDGTPSIVEQTLVRPPYSRIGAITAEERVAVVNLSPVKGQYDAVQDRESAYEMLKKRAETSAKAAEEAPVTHDSPAPAPRPRATTRRSDSVLEAAAKSVSRSIGSTMGRQIVRSIFGNLFGKKR